MMVVRAFPPQMPPSMPPWMPIGAPPINHAGMSHRKHKHQQGGHGPGDLDKAAGDRHGPGDAPMQGGGKGGGKGRADGKGMLERNSAMQCGTDREIMLEASKQNGYALKYAAKGNNADREIVLEAVKHNGYALTMRHKSSKRTVSSCSKP